MQFLLVALPVIAGVGLGKLLEHPRLAAATAGAVVVAMVALRFGRRHGWAAAWIAALALSILAGELSAVAVGGQSGRLLWADAILGMGVLWTLLRGGFEVRVPRAPFLTRLEPLILWGAVTLVAAGDVLTGLAELKEWLVAWAVAAAAASYATDERRARLLLGIVALTGGLVAVHMLYATLTSPFGPVLAVLLKKVDLPWGRSNYLAGILILALPVALGLLGHASTWRARIGWLAVAATNATGIVLSASKGGIIAIVAGLLVAFAPGGRSARVGAAVLAAMLGLGAAVFVAGPLRDVKQYRLQDSALAFSMGERMDLYRLAWDESWRHPVLGVGLNNFSVVSHRLRGVDTVPHNLELGFLAELGVPGLALALLWVTALGVAAWRTRMKTRAAQGRALGLGLWAAFVAFVIHNQFESTLYGQQFKILFMLVAAATWRIAVSVPRDRPAAGGPWPGRERRGSSPSHQDPPLRPPVKNPASSRHPACRESAT